MDVAGEGLQGLPTGSLTGWCRSLSRVFAGKAVDFRGTGVCRHPRISQSSVIGQNGISSSVAVTFRRVNFSLFATSQAMPLDVTLNAV